METSHKNAHTFSKMNLASWKKLSHIFGLNVLAWLGFTAIMALTSLNEDLRAGLSPDYWEVFKDWGDSAMALATLSAVIYLCLSRWPAAVSSGKKIILSYVLLLLLLLPLQLIFVLQLLLSEHDQSLSWSAMQAQIMLLDRYSSLLRVSSVSAVFFAVVIVKIWQQSKAREQAWQQERADNLSLRLALEQQKHFALRAQLEPHFMFNALNAISALVLTENKENAMNGIQALSELLRYALAASEKTSVKLVDEFAFVRDYIALQKLRYGSRLQISIIGMDAAIGDVDCPPLLLQPLVENALRHDLDCHQDASDILLSLSRQDDGMLICISNPLRNAQGEPSPNPGAGLGLRNTRARLQLVYGSLACLQTSVVEGRFQLELSLPLYIES